MLWSADCPRSESQKLTKVTGYAPASFQLCLSGALINELGSRRGCQSYLITNDLHTREPIVIQQGPECSTNLPLDRCTQRLQISETLWRICTHQASWYTSDM